MFESLSFRRGYLITKKGRKLDLPSRIKDWDVNSSDRYTIYTHQELPNHIYQDQDDFVAILGRVIDPINNISNEDIILKNIYERLSDSLEDFFDYLELLTGRFVIFVDEEKYNLVLQDATGNLSLFYEIQSDNCLLSSHPGIIAKIGNHHLNLQAERIIHSKASSFPGIATPYPRIKMLTPNTLLNLPNMSRKRFFPRARLRSREISDQLLNKMASILKKSVDLLNNENKLSLSLTSGLDSRLSLATTKDISGEVQFYTWAGGDPGSEEVPAVKSLCDHLDIDLEIIKLGREVPSDFIEVFMDNTSRMSRLNRAHTAYNLLRSYPENTMDLRSNVAEIGRTYYRDRMAFLPNNIDNEIFSKLYSVEPNSAYVQKKFEEFIEVTEFKKEKIYNYDPYDLFYWEYRMGNWLSLWLLEYSIAIDEFILFNNRYLLKMMLSVDYKHRRKNDIFHKLIDKLWSKCLEIPINPHKNKMFPYSNKIKRLFNGAVFRFPPSMYSKIDCLRREI